MSTPKYRKVYCLVYTIDHGDTFEELFGFNARACIKEARATINALCSNDRKHRTYCAVHGYKIPYSGYTARMTYFDAIDNDVLGDPDFVYTFFDR